MSGEQQVNIKVVNGVVYGQDAAVAAWTTGILGQPVIATGLYALGMLRDGVETPRLPDDLVCGVVFFHHFDAERDEGYSDCTVQVAVTDITAVRPAALRQILDFAFGPKDKGNMALRRVTAYIDLSNERAVRNAMKIGFKLEGRKPRMSPSGDVGLFGLYPDGCPFWLSDQELTDAAQSASVVEGAP